MPRLGIDGGNGDAICHIYGATGIKKGRVEGRLKQARKLTLQTVAIRFGNVPPIIAKTIAAQNDISKLDALFEWALTTDSFKSFPFDKP